MKKSELRKLIREEVENSTPLIRGEDKILQSILDFVNDEDNHTEGELGNSTIDVQTLINFIFSLT